MEKNFPSKKTIKRIKKKLMCGLWTASLPPNASRTERFKYDLCERLVMIMQNQSLSQREFAKRLAIHESRISEIIHYKLKKVSVEKLMHYLELVDDKVCFKVA